MYLLYEAEFDKTVKGEQKKLVKWIREAARLNPGIDLATILKTAEERINDTTYTVKSKAAMEEEEAAAKAATQHAALPAAPTPQPVTPEPEYEAVYTPEQEIPQTLPEEINIVDEDEDFAPPIELQQIEPPVEDVVPVYENVEPVQNIEDIMNDNFDPSTPSVPLNDSVDFAKRQAGETYSEYKEPVTTPAPHMPAREENSEEVIKAKKIRDNMQAIYNDPQAIKDL